MFLRSTAPISLLTILSLIAAAQDKTPEKLKEIATEAMKKAEVNDARFIETDNLIVATPLPDAKAKTLAEALQKTCAMAKKGLKFDATDAKEPKTIVYAFIDLDQYRQFSRSVLKMRPDDDEFAKFDVKADVPFIAVAPRRGEKVPNLESIAGAEVCRALLAKKGGNARLSEWMKDGFARAVAMRLNPGSAAADRAAVRRLAPRLAKTVKGMPVVDRAWSGTGKEKDLVAASLMDFFTFGTGAEKFGTLLSALIPSDAIASPTFADALKGADWMVEDLDRAWRDWLAAGSPAGK
jgi:hypothetical protein